MRRTRQRQGDDTSALMAPPGPAGGRGRPVASGVPAATTEDPVVVADGPGRRPVARAVDARDRLIAQLGRLVPAARHVHAGITGLAIAGAAAAVVIGAVVAVGAPGDAGGRVVAGLVLAGLLAVPAVVLMLFRRALGEVLELPEKLRRYPDLVRAHGPELAQLVVAARGRGRATGRRSFLGDLVRAVKLLFQAVGNLPDKGALLPLVNVPFLIAVAASAVAVILEVALAFLLLAALPLWLALR